MTPNPVHRLPAPLEAAVQRLKMAARNAAERTIESLGLAALASTNAFQRDGLLGAQFEFNRKSAVFVLKFNDALDARVLRELGPRADAGSDAAAASATPASGPLSTGASSSRVAASTGPSDWDALTLVEDKEVEAQISAERFGMDIAHACEWELRELEGYVSSLLGDASGGQYNAGDRNPLRPDIVGHAMIRGIEAVSERDEVRKLLATELSRSLSALLPSTYADIVGAMRNAGVQPMSLTVRNRAARAAAQADGADSVISDSAYAPLQPGGQGGQGGPRGAPIARDSMGRALVDERPGQRPGFAPSARAGFAASGGRSASASTRSGTLIGQVDPGLMDLIRRLAYADAEAAHASGRGADGTGSDGGFVDDAGDAGDGQLASGPVAAPRNVIRANRAALQQASTGALDHMVIDVIGFLFDQILSDPKVPPQLARQIARLQLPVLRAALGDRNFFASRKHPVRRFINRIASLGSAFEDFGDDAAKGFLAKVRALVQDVVEGDFDQIELYEQKLAALEAFVAEQAAHDGSDQGQAAALLSEKEDQQRLRQLYAQRLAGDLKDLAAPPFLREFLSGVWSQVLLRAAEQGGADGPMAQRLRHAGRELFLSVQPKATPAHRKAFLAELPRLMQELTEGMNLIAWPEAQRRVFFGQLMPAHAEALKSPAGRTLDINLMARQLDGVLQRPLPSRDDLKAAQHLPVLTDALDGQQFSAEEAQRIGLVAESAVNWDGQVDIDLSADAEPVNDASAALPVAPGLPALKAGTEPAEPTEGRALADHVQIGFAYRMHLDDSWQKVRLSHVSTGRSFFIFSLGGRHKRTISLTRRMLERLCETGRLKAFETSYLVERATARARRQLAAGTAAAA